MYSFFSSYDDYSMSSAGYELLVTSYLRSKAKNWLPPLVSPEEGMSLQNSDLQLDCIYIEIYH